MLGRVLGALLLVGAAVALARPGWTRLDGYPVGATAELPTPFRSMADHDRVMSGRSWPYLLELRPASPSAEPAPALIYFGSYHTNEFDDPQIERIGRLWAVFGPTVAVTENRLGFHLWGRRGAVRAHGEFAEVARLSRASGIPVHTLEPAWEDEVAELKRDFPVEELIVFYTLRVFLNERAEVTPEELDRLAESLLAKRAGRPGLGREHIPDLAHFDDVWRERFPGLGDWRELPDHAVHPSARPTHLQRIATVANEVRDRHAARTILALLSRGERVFALAGGSHVVKQEPVLRAAFRTMAFPAAAPRRASDALDDALCDTIPNGFRCARAIESRLLKAGADPVQRRGDTLRLARADGTPLDLVDRACCEGDPLLHSFAGAIDAWDLYIVHGHYYEGAEHFAIDRVEGTRTTLWGRPILSPIGRWIVAGNASVDAGYSSNGFQVWGRDNAGRLRLQWEHDPESWGPTSYAWVNDSTAAFTGHGWCPGFRGLCDVAGTLEHRDGAWRTRRQ